MSYEIARYTPALQPMVLELQRHLWGPDDRLNAAYLEWKHEQNPYVDAPLIYLALWNGEPVGMRSMCGAKWQVRRDGGTCLVPMAGDLVVVPAHRQRGVIPLIMGVACADLASRGYEYMFNLSGNRVTFLSSLASGWRAIGDLAPLHWIGPVGASEREGGLFDELDRHGMADATAAIRLATSPMPAAMAALIERLGHDGRIRHVRDEPYFNWRFLNPRAAYRFLFSGETTLDGFLVLRHKIGGLNSPASVVDCVDFEASSPAVLANLFEAALTWGRFPEVRVWAATLSQPARRVLSAAGFVPVERRGLLARAQPTVLVGSTDGSPSELWSARGVPLLNMESWDMRMIYSEGV